MRDPDLILRRAKASDVTGFAHCLDAAYARYRTTITDLPDMTQGCAEEIANHQVWLVSHHDRIVGCLVLKTHPDHMMLANVAVAPDFGGRGIGRALIDLSETQFLQQGYDTMRLNTHAAMTDNLALYGHLGWVERSRTGETVTMEKHLDRLGSQP